MLVCQVGSWQEGLVLLTMGVAELSIDAPSSWYQ